MARTGQIGETLRYTEAAVKKIKDAIKGNLADWMDRKNDNQLMYDESWGGIVTHDGINDKKKDYGNGIYTDHIFQYGYIVYAAAYALKNDTTDFAANYTE